MRQLLGTLALVGIVITSMQAHEERASVTILGQKRKTAKAKKVAAKTPWFRAVNDGQGTVEAIMAFLIQNPDTDINAADKSNNNKTALQYAASANNDKLCTYLLQQSANINTVCTIALSPVVADPDNIKLTLKNLVTIRKKEVGAILTNTIFLLYGAGLQKMRPEKVSLLIKSGAVVQAADTLGNAALHYAAQAGNIAVCAVLIDAGAYADAKNNLGKRPRDMATGDAVALLAE